jgi:hypothetical protein
MEFKEPIKEYPVIEYDFAFAGGGRLPVVLDEAKGDYMQDLGEFFRAELSEKPNILDPEHPIPAKQITIFKRNINAFTKETRMQREPTQEELFNMQKTLHDLAKGIQ